MGDENKVYVGKLDWNATEDDLYEVFDKFGKVTDGEITVVCVYQLTFIL